MIAEELKAGAKSVAPMLVGVVPFGLVAGASPVDKGLGGGIAIGLATIVFAGASQLAAIDVLGDGGSALLAALAAWTINLRLLLYSASIAPHLAGESLRTRLGVAYLLTDQSYIVSIQRWTSEETPPERRIPYYMGAALALWGSWQVAVVTGVVVGPVIPEDVPVEFAVPLVFLVLLIPALDAAPAVVAAVTGGLAAVVTLETGAAKASIMIGAAVGIVSGTLAELAVERRGGGSPSSGLDVGSH